MTLLQNIFLYLRCITHLANGRGAIEKAICIRELKRDSVSLLKDLTLQYFCIVSAGNYITLLCFTLFIVSSVLQCYNVFLSKRFHLVIGNIDFLL